MCEDVLTWRDNTIRVTGIVVSMIFVALYFIYLCLVGIARKRNLIAKPPSFYSDDENVEILRKTSELPDLTPPPSYEVLQEPPPPSYNSVLGGSAANE
ncbi:hypothetical protein CAEBREN_13725 [Caenorhabditis brenneri]|uniref:Uncharacterized protein n=1 Tax=Caenorhabditis brenneri TaxID=135651 RepID=G0P837_CAEBE|nr:hypothetical protein CAEBREN_13725 [Caenorhabditis brenneri]